MTMTRYESFLNAKNGCVWKSKKYMDEGNTEMADFYEERAKEYEEKMLSLSLEEASTMVGLN